MTDAAATTFDFTALAAGHPGGPTLRGSVEATHPASAEAAIVALGLRPVRVTPAVDEPVVAASAAPAGADFYAFNQQLAHLTRAGLPVEPGIRLLAEDAGRGRLARGITAVSADLEAGVPLAEALGRHRDAFPPLYANLVDAGVRTGRLPEVLLNLGLHLRQSRRFASAIWQAGAYPLVVLLVLMIVTAFVGLSILPEFREIYESFGTELPASTVLVVSLADWIPGLLIAVGCLVFGSLTLGLLARLTGRGPWLRDAVVRRLPLLGPAVTQGLLARWCGLVAIGVRAGLDLPAALALAGDATGCRPLRADGEALTEALREGLPVDAGAGTGTARARMLPRPVTLAMAHGVEHGTLPEAMEDLASLYGGQAEMRLVTMHTALGPLFFGVLGVGIGFLVVTLFLPLVKLTSSLM